MHYDLANTRSRMLFFDHLTKEQRKSYHFLRRINVLGSLGKEWYQINCSLTVSNIVRLSDRCALCLGIVDDYGYNYSLDRKYPIFDTLLAQVLIIETNEPLFLEIANVRGFLSWPIIE